MSGKKVFMLYTLADTHNDNGKLIWDTDGYYAVGDSKWKDLTLTADMIYQGGEFGIIPRFNSEITYLSCIIGSYTSADLSGLSFSGSKTIARLSAQISTNKLDLAENSNLPDLVVGQTYQLVCQVKRTNYKVYLDGSLIFNIEYNGLQSGKVAAYGEAGTKCDSIEIKSEFPEGWTSNVDSVSGALVDIQKLDNDDAYLHIKSDGTDSVYLEQLITVLPLQPYTLSFSLSGGGKAELIEVDGTQATHSSVLSASEEWVSRSYTFTTSTGCTQIKLRFSATDEIQVNNVQLEKGEDSTGYIHNEDLVNSASREASFLTYPSKENINSKEGSASLWMYPLTEGTSAILEYGDTNGELSVSQQALGIAFKYQGVTLTAAGSLTLNEWNHVAITWSEHGMSLTVNSVRQANTAVQTFLGASDVIRIGHSSLHNSVFTGAIDDLIIFSKVITEVDILKIYSSENPILNIDQMILRATFDHAIGSFNKSIIEITPSPAYGSPVIVQKEDGTPMRKVSFFDPISGEYRTYNEEYVPYDGTSDYIRVGYPDIENENFKIQVKDQSGAIVGDPYTVDNNKILLTLTAEQKKELRGKPLFVSYQPEDAYTVDFNIEQPDSFRVTVGKHDGKPVEVTYEGNRYSEEKLATMIELNPLLNPNHQGFLYITKTPGNTSVFRVKASPNFLFADGVSESAISIEPLDQNGNFASNVKLSVVAKYGQVLPKTDAGSIRVREEAGRHLYRYRAPLLSEDKFASSELPEYINVIDQVSGLGVQIPMTLFYGNIERIEDRQQTLKESEWEEILVYILGKVTDHINTKAADLSNGLGALLDLNEDGLINIQEIVWLNNNKLTTSLYNKYLAIQNWYRLNG
jgi:hypothetical protein